MKDFFLKHRELVLLMGGAAILVLAAGIWAYFALRGIEQPLILHFSSYTGINQIGPLAALLGAALTGLVIVFINALLLREIEPRDKSLARLVGFATLFFAILIFIGFAAIISVNS